MAFYCLEIISKDRNGLKLEKVGPILIRFPQKSLVSYFHSDLLYCLTIQRFQGSIDYFEDSLMFVFLFHQYGGPQRQYTNIYYITTFYILVQKHLHWLYEYIYQYNKIYTSTTICIPVKFQYKNRNSNTEQYLQFLVLK